MWSKYDYFYYTFQTAGPFVTKLSLIVQHHKPECSVEKLGYCLQVKVTTSFQNVSECLLGWYLLIHRTFCYQTLYGDAASWARVSCRKKMFLSSWPRSQQVSWCFEPSQSLGIISGPIRMWLRQLCLLNCWFFGNQTWSDDASSWARVFCEKKKDYYILGQGHSERSKCWCLSRWYLLNCQSVCY